MRFNAFSDYPYIRSMIFRLNAFLRVFFPALLAYLLLPFYFRFQVIDQLTFQQHALSLFFSLGYFFRSSVFILVVYLIAPSGSKKTTLGISATFYVLTIMLHAALMGYQLETGILLGADLFGYTFSDIHQTVGASAAGSLGLLFVLLAACSIAYLLHRWLKKKNTPTALRYAVMSLVLLSWVLPTNPSASAYPSEGTYFLMANPSSYFWTKAYGHLVQAEETPVTTMREYPFLHVMDEHNPLDLWLNKSERAPNIVFVTVEGLGADFVGPGAIYGGATPFLDSLIGVSLYWPYCFSNTGRTFGVLPTLTGSLPYSQSGFMSKGPEMPDHLSIISILKPSGYYTAYFHGGNTNFDGQDLYLERQGTDYIMDQGKFPAHYQKMKSNAEGFSWGYGDKEVFDYSIKKMEAVSTEQPFLNFYMTLTTHEPFSVPDPYYSQYAEALANRNNIPPARKKVFKEYANVFACLNYSDDAIRQLINGYQKRNDFDQTIFVITGDHRLIPVPAENRLQRFHVPFMIYSPMIKKPMVNEQLITHAQVTPTLLSYLHQTYQIAVPEQNSFIAPTFPVAAGFGSSLDIPLMRNKNEMEEYISALHLLSDGRVFQIEKGLALTPLENNTLKTTLLEKLELFKRKSNVAMNENRLIPDTLLSPATHQSEILSTEDRQYLTKHRLLATAPDTLFFTARQLAFEKNFIESRIILKYGLSRSPNYHDMRVLLARTFAWDDQYDSAYVYLDETLRRAEDYEDAYIAYADAAYWDDQPDLSLKMSLTGIQNYPTSLELKCRAARIYLEKNQTKMAATLVNEVLAEAPKHELANSLKNRLPATQ